MTKTIGELRAFVGENRVNWMAEGIEKTLETGRDCICPTIRNSVDMDKALRALNGDEDIGTLCLPECAQSRLKSCSNDAYPQHVWR